MRRLLVCALLSGAIACASSPRQSPNPVPGSPIAPVAAQGAGRADTIRADTIFVMPPLSQFTSMTSGVMYYDLSLGTGLPALDLREIEIHYTGRLEGGRVFDSSRERGTPIKFVLGQGRVIPGWEQGVRGMRVGGRRILVIPPSLAYGPNGSPPDIPPNATLTFDLQLISVR